MPGRKAARLLVGLSAAIAVLGMAVTAEAQEKKIKIGVITTLSGPAAVLGRLQMQEVPGSGEGEHLRPASRSARMAEMSRSRRFSSMRRAASRWATCAALIEQRAAKSGEARTQRKTGVAAKCHTTKDLAVARCLRYALPPCVLRRPVDQCRNYGAIRASRARRR